MSIVISRDNLICHGMTIIQTFLSFGGKSDNAPYQPKLLETGDGGFPNAKNNNNDSGNDESDTLKCDADLFANSIGFVLIPLLLLLSLSSINENLRMQRNDAVVAWKCYSSYADAESDMLLLPDSPLPNSKKMVIDPVEGVIRKVPMITIRSPQVKKLDRFLLVNDFCVNITGIIDFESQRCYVMQLLNNSFEPHESLCDTSLEMSTGYYSLDNINKILSCFPMVKPAITNPYDYGMYISKHCADYPTFKLERDIAPIPHKKFTDFHIHRGTLTPKYKTFNTMLHFSF